MRVFKRGKIIIQLNPPLPLISPKGECLCHFLIDDGIEHHLKWVCIQDNSGEIWTWSNPDIRGQKNITHGREYISPFYDPDDVSLVKDVGSDVDSETEAHD